MQLSSNLNYLTVTQAALAVTAMAMAGHCQWKAQARSKNASESYYCSSTGGTVFPTLALAGLRKSPKSNLKPLFSLMHDRSSTPMPVPVILQVTPFRLSGLRNLKCKHGTPELEVEGPFSLSCL